MNENGPDQSDSVSSAQSCPWRNRFTHPSAADLLMAYPEELASIANHVCKAVGRLRQVRKEVRWQGHSWCWTVTFRHPSLSRQCAAELAYLIPSPDALQYSIPLNDAMLEANVDGSESLVASDYIRETIDLACNPHAWYWPIWVINTLEEADLLIELTAAKHAFLTREA